MILIAGLGNPGRKYKKTRHNLGFIAIDEVAKNLDAKFKFSKKFNADIADFTGGKLAKPQTYMNNSGNAVSKIVNFYKIKPENLWVVYDDIDLDLGTIRQREKGSSGGHNGVKSIINTLGTEKFNRLRIGIGPVPVGYDPADFVLGKFTKEEKDKISKAVKEAVSRLLESV